MTSGPSEPPQQSNATNLCIFQINLNKSEKAHLDLINAKLSKKYDIILIQEPHTIKFNKIRMPPNFRLVFPSHQIANQEPVHSVIWVNRCINTNKWTILNIPDTNNITAIQLTNNKGVTSIFNMIVLTTKMKWCFTHLLLLTGTKS